ncbi:MAG: redox-sensing transcriptional repressor Rex [Lachnospiraceae bacterium]|nr:redox-sensing transcriptional repressor Rex [Lachnospiraceae bacterium]
MISKATLSRLPEYLEYLRQQESFVTDISATAIAKGLHLGEVQVRKDLSSVCGNGKPKTGYNIDDLKSSIEHALGKKQKSEAVIIGAGKLGKALLSFDGFSEYGLLVRTAFDSSLEVIGDNILPMEELASYCSLHQVEIGILTVPPEYAQEASEKMVKAGIKAILCFSAKSLNLPDGIAVHYENLALSLAHLKQKTV